MGDFEIIYETKGKAKEYAPLGVELYTGCSYGCKYCFVPKTLNISVEEFHKNYGPVKDALNKLKRDAELLKAKQDDQEILLCFHSDPYQRFTEEYKNITGQAIEILVANDLRFTILTKSGLLGTNHFDLLWDYEKFSFGTTLIFTNQDDADKWEPNADKITSRLEAIKMARNKRIKTWVSLEPVIDPKQALQLIDKYHPIVDHWKIGKINYHPEIEAKVDWIRFREEVKSLLDSLKADYYLKKSLTDWIDPDSKQKDITMATKTGAPIAEEKMTKPESPWTEGDIPTRRGNCNILVIAPHGYKDDDENTYEMARQMADELDCYAVVNQVYRRSYEEKDKKLGKLLTVNTDKENKIVDLNNIGEVETNLKSEYLAPIVDFKNKIVNAYGNAFIVLIHGIDDDNINDEDMVAKLGGPKDLLIGIGQLGKSETKEKGLIKENEIDRFTLGNFEVHRLIESFDNNSIKTALAPIRSRYCGWDTNNMNQLFNQKREHKIYYDSKVRSVQLEIKKKDRREGADQARKTGTLLAKAFTEFVELNKPIKRVNIDDIQVKKEADRKCIFRVVLDSDAEIKELAEDIKINGLVHPLALLQKKDGKYILISGYRRFQALKRLGEKWIEAKIFQEVELTEQELINISLSENTKRRNLNPIEIGNFFESAAKQLNLSKNEELADLFGGSLGAGAAEGTVSQSTVSKYRNLFKVYATGESKAMIDDIIKGGLQFSLAAEILVPINVQDRNALYEIIVRPFKPTRPQLKQIKNILEKLDKSLSNALAIKEVTEAIEQAAAKENKTTELIKQLNSMIDPLLKQKTAFYKEVTSLRRSVFGKDATDDDLKIIPPPRMSKPEITLQFKLKQDDFKVTADRIKKLLNYKKEIEKLWGILKK